MTTFLPEVLAHEKNRQILQSFYQYGNIPQTIMFTGPKGVGKHLLAMRWAQFLLCENPQKENTACNECGSCFQMQRGNHPDLVHLFPEKGKGITKNISIEQVRKFISASQYSGMRSSRKVLIIDDADSLSSLSQNALLKTLEEAVDNQFIVLIAHQRQALLKTVQSRAIELRFRLLSDDAVRAIWQKAHDQGLADSPVNESIFPFLSGRMEKLDEFLQEDGNLLDDYLAFFNFIQYQAPLALGADAAKRTIAVDWLEKWSQLDRERLLWLTDFVLYRSRDVLAQYLDQEKNPAMAQKSIDYWQSIMQSALDFKKFLLHNGNILLGLSHWLSRFS